MDRRFAKAICLVMIAAVLASPCRVLAQEGSLWENTTGTQSETTAVDSKTLQDGSLQEAAAAAEETGDETGLEREKKYLLQALCRLEDMGLSPVKIWSDITKDERVVARMDSVRETVTETVSQKVTEAEDAASDAVEEAVTKETEKIKKSLAEMIKEQISDFFSNLFGGI